MITRHSCRLPYDAAVLASAKEEAAEAVRSASAARTTAAVTTDVDIGDDDDDVSQYFTDSMVSDSSFELTRLTLPSIGADSPMHLAASCADLADAWLRVGEFLRENWHVKVARMFLRASMQLRMRLRKRVIDCIKIVQKHAGAEHDQRSLQFRKKRRSPKLKLALEVVGGLAVACRDVAIACEKLALLEKAQTQYAVAEALMKRSFELLSEAAAADERSTIAAGDLPSSSSSSLSVLNDIQAAAGPLFSDGSGSGSLTPTHAMVPGSPVFRPVTAGAGTAVVSPLLQLEHGRILAELQFLQHRYDRAEALYAEILSRYEELVGPDHSTVGQVVEDLALLYSKQSRFADAQNLLMRSIDIKRATLGENHPGVAVARRKLAGLLLERSRYREADSLLENVISVLSERFSTQPDHPEIISARNLRAVSLQARGCFDEAEAILVENVERVKTHSGAFHPEAQNQLSQLAELYHKLARFDEEARILAEVDAIRHGQGQAETNGASPSTEYDVFAIHNQAQLALTKGKLSHALREERRALSMASQKFGKNHVQTARLFSALGVIYARCAQFARAETCQRRAMNVFLANRDAVNTAFAQSKLAYVLTSIGRFDEAAQLHLAAIDATAAVHGTNSVDVAVMRGNLGYVRFRQGRLDEALELHRRALADIERSYQVPKSSSDGHNGDTDHPAVARACHDTAELLLELGELAEAEKLHARALAIRRARYGARHSDVATSFRGMALVEAARGRYQDAQRSIQCAIDIMRECVEETHPKLAKFIFDHARIVYLQGDYKEATRLYEKAISGWRQAYSLSMRERGGIHPDLAQGLHRLGYVYATRGAYQRAARCYLTAHGALSDALGSDHAEVAGVESSLGWVYLREGHFAKAEELYASALSKRTKYFGSSKSVRIDAKMGEPIHPAVAQAHFDLAGLFLTLGRFFAAYDHSVKALKIRQRLYSHEPGKGNSVRRSSGNTHVDVARSQSQLAQIHFTHGMYDEATRLLEEAYEILRAVYGPEHVKVADVLYHWGRVLNKEGSFSRARFMLVDARSIRQNSLGTRHPDVAMCDNELAFLEARMGNFDAAVDRYRIAKSILHDAYGFYSRAEGNDTPFVTDASASSSGTSTPISAVLGRDDIDDLRFQGEEDSEDERMLHPQEALVTCNLAWALMRRGRQEETPTFAARLLSSATAAVTAFSTPPEVVAEAASLFREAERSLIFHLSENHPDVSRVRHDLGQLLWHVPHQRTLARALILRSLESRRQVLSESHLSLARSLISYARMLRQSVSCGGATSSLEDEDLLSVKRHRATIFGHVWAILNPPPVIDLGGPSRLAENRPSFMLTGGPSRIDLQRSLACTLAALNIARRSVGEHNPRYAEFLLELATLALSIDYRPRMGEPSTADELVSGWGIALMSGDLQPGTSGDMPDSALTMFREAFLAIGVHNAMTDVKDIAVEAVFELDSDGNQMLMERLRNYGAMSVTHEAHSICSSRLHRMHPLTVSSVVLWVEALLREDPLRQRLTSWWSVARHPIVAVLGSLEQTRPLLRQVSNRRGRDLEEAELVLSRAMHGVCLSPEDHAHAEDDSDNDRCGDDTYILAPSEQHLFRRLQACLLRVRRLSRRQLRFSLLRGLSVASVGFFLGFTAHHARAHAQALVFPQKYRS
jgi:tetratricopeptide (TPR) repeat protein